MDYKAVVEDLNSDLESEFGFDPLIDGAEYTYITSGGVDRIEFYGVEIFHSEDCRFGYGKEISEMTVPEFEDYLEEIVFNIGKKFLKYSFMPSGDIAKSQEDLHNAEVHDADCMEGMGIYYRIPYNNPLIKKIKGGTNVYKPQFWMDYGYLR